MTQEQILENNKLIAEFMNISCFEEFNNSLLVSHPEEGIWYYEPLWYLDYHSDWSLLMPVVLKIETLGYRVGIIDCGCHINDNNGDYDNTIYDKRSKIEAVYQSVIEFINWHNQTNN